MCQNYTQDMVQLYHFHFRFRDLCQDMKTLTEEVIFKNLKELEEMLLNKFPECKESITESVTQLAKLYIDQAQEPLQKLIETTREIFKLPSNVIIPVYGRKTISEEEYNQLKKEVEDLENEYLEEIYYQAILKKEMENYEQIKPLYEKVNEVLKSNKQSKSKVGEKSVQELYEALKSCKKYYFSKKIGSRTDIYDEFNLFQTK